MIRFVPGNFAQAEWAVNSTRLDGLSLLQTWGWGAAKAEAGIWCVERGLMEECGQALGAAQVMIRKLPVIGGGLAWIARGPLYVADASTPYAALLAALRRHYVDERGFHLRIAPALPAAQADCDAIAAAGFRPAGAGGWISTVVNLSLSEEALRGSLAAKWRNGLKKAERLNLSVGAVEVGKDFDDFLTEYRVFLARRGFSTSVTPELLAAVQRSLPEGGKMIAWRCSRQGEPLGSALIARYGNRAEYLVGTLTDAARQYNVGQLLLWRALLSEKQRGTQWFDSGGADPNLTPKGVLSFKEGLGGTPYRLAEEIEANDGGARASLVRWRVNRARAGGGVTG